MDEKCILNPERDCLGLMKAEELEKDIQDMRGRNEKSHKEFFDRLAILEKQEGIHGEQYKNIIEKLSDMAAGLSELKLDSKGVISALTPLTHRVESLESKYQSISEDVTTLKEKPAKRWEGIVEKVIGLVVAAVVGFILARMGLS